MYNLYNLEANSSIGVFLQNFKKFLVAEKVAGITQRSYLSDVRFFFKWVYSFLLSNKQIEANTEVNQVISKLTAKTLSAYGEFLQNEEIPSKSVNRKFSALRKLGSFCLGQKLISENVFESLKTINQALPFPEKTYRLGEWTADLNRRKISKITVKNYLSDVKQFLSRKDLRRLQADSHGSDNHNKTNQYKEHLIKSGVSPATVERKLSSIGKYLDFINRRDSSTRQASPDSVGMTNIHPRESFTEKEIASKLASLGIDGRELKLVKSDPRSSAGNPRKSLAKIKGLLENVKKLRWTVPYNIKYSQPQWLLRYKKLSFSRYLNLAVLLIVCIALGIGGYDQFVRKTKKEGQVLGTLPTAPPTKMSFQGRLTDSFGNPIVTSTAFTFNLYSVGTGGTALWTETKNLTPDTDGIFNTYLGDTTTMDSTIFRDNTNLYLGIGVSSDPEMEPRQQVATVGYAFNSQYLQGYGVGVTGATTNTIPIVDGNGNLVIASASPAIESTSGSFKIVGKEIYITTTGGNINLDPNALGAGGTGNINATSSIVNGNVINATSSALLNGALYFGSIGNTSASSNLIRLQSGNTLIDRFYVNNSGTAYISGNLGIGNTNPTSALAVTGAGYISNGLNVGVGITSPKITLTTGASSGYLLQSDASGNATWISATGIGGTYSASNGLTLSGSIFKLGGTLSEQTNINQAGYNLGIYGGNVGIGTTSPGTKLNILGTQTAGYNIPEQVLRVDATTDALGSIANGFGVGINFNASRGSSNNLGNRTGWISSYLISGAQTTEDLWGMKFGVRDNDTEVTALTILNAGNVGIGTTNPGAKLSLGSDSNAKRINIFENAGGGNAYGIGFAQWRTYLTANGTEVLNIDSTGNVGIGTTNPAQKLEVNVATDAWGMRLSNTADGYAQYSWHSFQGYDNANAASQFLINPVGGNVGIGTTNPNQKLEVTGNLTFSGTQTNSDFNTFNNGIVFPSGSGGLSNQGSAITGKAASTGWGGILQFITRPEAGGAALERMTIRETGNVGIGTTAPEQALHIVKSGADNFVMVKQGTAGNSAGVQFVNQAGVSSYVYSYQNSGNVRVYESGADRLTITSGNVGIGTTSPLASLEIGGAGNVRIGGLTASQAVYTDANKQLTSTPPGTGTLGYWTRSGTTLYPTTNTDNVTTLGNIGIGTTSPGAKLDIYQTGGASGTNTALLLEAGNNSNYFGNNQIVFGYDRSGISYSQAIKTRHNGGADTGNAIDFYTWDYGTDAIGTVGTKHGMTIEAGNVGIGTVSPGAKLDVQAGNLRVYDDGVTGSTIEFKRTTDNWTPGQIKTTYASPYGSNMQFDLHPADNILGTAPITRMYINSAGNVGIGTTNPAAKLDVAGGMINYSSTPIDVTRYYDDNTLFTLQAYIENNSSLINGVGTVTTVTDTTVPFSKVMLSSAFVSGNNIGGGDYIPVRQGEILYGEIWVKRDVGATGVAGILYAGMQIYDSSKTAGNANSGRVYPFAAAVTIPADGVWYKYSAEYTVPAATAPGSGPVRYITPLVYINYNTGTIPTYWGGFVIRRKQVFRDSGDATFAGNVGIGGLTASQAVYTDANKQLTSTPPGTGTLGYWTRSGTTLYPTTNTDNVTTLGNIGIGTTSPAAKLNISYSAFAGSPVFSEHIRTVGVYTHNIGEFIKSADVTSGLTTFSSGSINQNIATNFAYRWYSGQTTATDLSTATPLMILKSDGNVGIGTAAPGAKLHVVDDSAVTTVGLLVTNNYGTSADQAAATIAMGRYAGANWASITGRQQVASNFNYGQLFLGTRTSDALGVETKMTILANGYVGIGTTNPLGKLEISSTMNAAPTTGSIVLSHPTNYQRSSVVFPSRINYASDYGFIEYRDDDNDSGEAAQLTIGTSNDADDDVVIDPSGRLQILATNATLDVSGNLGLGSGTVTAAQFTGNAATATTLIGDQTNWASYRTNAVANMLSWKNYGSGHVIFDASASTSPTGSAVNNTNAAIPWSATYPTLMGWNSVSTYGVRVDSARIADVASSFSHGGTTNYVSKFTGATSLGNSQIFDNGTNVGIGTTAPESKLNVTGTITGHGNGQLYLSGIGSNRFSYQIADMGWTANNGGTVSRGTDNTAPHYDVITLTKTASASQWHGTWGNIESATITTGDTYKVSFWYKTSNKASTNMYINILKDDWSGLTNANAAVLIEDGQWHYYEGNLTATATYTGNLHYYIDWGYSASAGTVYVAGIKYLKNPTIGSGLAGINIIESQQSALLLNPAVGNVGIGTTSPGAKLDLYHDSAGYSNTAYNAPSLYLTASATTNDYSGIGFRGSTGARESFFGVVQGGAGDYSNFVFQGYDGTSHTYKEFMRINDVGNVGIGTTNPAAKLSFATMNDGRDTADGITWYNLSPLTYGIYRSAGTWAAPNYQQLTLSWDTGIVMNPGTLYGKSYVDIQGNGLRVTSGNVGIGTTAPTAKLYVRNADDAATANIGQFFANNLTQGIGIGYNRIEAVGSNANQDILILPKGTGNVGIGTTAPLSKLHVAGKVIINANDGVAGNYNEGIRINDDSNNYAVIQLGGATNSSSGTGVGQWSLIANPNDDFELRENGDTHLTVLDTGNVGIGTTNPSTGKLVVSAGSIGVGADIGGLVITGDPRHTSSILNINDTANYDCAGCIRTGASITMDNGSTGSQTNIGLNVAVSGEEINYAALFSGGNVGIGTASPGTTLDVAGNTRTSGYLSITGAGDGSGNLRFSAANPYIYATSYFISPGGAYFNSGTVYTEATIQARGGIADDGGDLGLLDNVYLTGYLWDSDSDLYINDNVLLGAGSYDSGAVVDIGSISTDYQANSGWAATWNSNLLLSGSDYTTITFHDSSATVGALGHVSNSFFFDGAGTWGPVSLGINDRSPDAFLDVTGNGSTTPFRVDDSGEGDSTPFIILSSGNVGIGTTSPGGKLEVSGGNLKMTSGNIVLNYNWLSGDGGNEGLAVNSTGSVGIGTTSPIDTLQVMGGATFEGAINVHFSGTSATHVCTNGGGYLGSCSSDYSEYMPTSDEATNIDKSDLVSVSRDLNEINDPTAQFTLEKPNTPYDPKLIGVVSSSNGGNGSKRSEDYKSISLNGRAPVKVATINGEIKAGDPITSSSLKGIGMKSTKAGQIIGKALENQVYQAEQCQAVQSIEEIVWPDINWDTEPDQITDDWRKYCYRLPDETIVSRTLLFVNPSWYDPDTLLTASGDLLIKNSNQTYDGLLEKSADDRFSDSNLQTIFNDSIAKLTDNSGKTIERIGSFGQLVTAKIRTGLITTTDLIAKNIFVQKLSVAEKIVSPVIETNQIQSTGFDVVDSNGEATMSVDTENKVVSYFGKLLVEGDAEFAGNVTVSGLSSLGDLSVSGNATISGELVADSARIRKLRAESIEGLEAFIATIAAQNISTNVILSGSEGSSQDSSPAEPVQNDDTPNLGDLSSSWPITDPSGDIKIEANITILGVTSLAQTIVSGPITQDGTLLLDEGNSVNVLGGTLYLQNKGLGGGIDLLAGKVTIDSLGNAVFSGDLTVKGKLNVGFAQITDDKVATGSAMVAGISIERETNLSEPDLDGIVQASASAGISDIPVGNTEVIIKSPFVTAKSLIYLTPIGSTGNQVIYLKSTDAETKTFTVAVDNTVTTGELRFNWWIVN